jgi:hypothetical protein
MAVLALILHAVDDCRTLRHESVIARPFSKMIPHFGICRRSERIGKAAIIDLWLKEAHDEATEEGSP